MDQKETERLPDAHWFEIRGVILPCLYKIDAPHFPAAIVQFVKSGRRDP